ncbi:MAG: hypothetical protein JWQ23_4423 [Herminiimonas sp.]|nr:hypothetical protein [Herminiimonas sp.]
MTLFLSSPVHAITLEGTAQGVFSNPLPADKTVAGEGTNEFTWGTASPTQNMVKFTSGPFSATTDAPFKIGTLFYFNGITVADTNPETVDLTVLLTYFSPVEPNNTSVLFNLALHSTPNIVDDELSADFVSISTINASTKLILNGQSYILVIDGFRNVTGDGLLNQDPTQFHLVEQGSARADLYVSLKPDTDVPEPATPALLGLGLLGLAASRKYLM